MQSISEIGGPNKLYFSDELLKCLWMVLVFNPDLLCPPLEVRGASTSGLKVTLGTKYMFTTSFKSV